MLTIDDFAHRHVSPGSQTKTNGWKVYGGYPTLWRKSPTTSVWEPRRLSRDFLNHNAEFLTTDAHINKMENCWITFKHIHAGRYGSPGLTCHSSTSSPFAGASAGVYPESWPPLGQIRPHNTMVLCRALRWRAVSRRETRPSRLSTCSPPHSMVEPFVLLYTIKLAHSHLPVFSFNARLSQYLWYGAYNNRCHIPTQWILPCFHRRRTQSMASARACPSLPKHELHLPRPHRGPIRRSI
jgi:hypothetical protein